MHGYDDAYGAFMAFLGHTSNKEDEGQPVAVGWETGAVSSKVDCQARDARAVWNVLVHFSRGGKRGCDVFYKR